MSNEPTTARTETEIGIGTRVSYEDMANPLREGTITAEIAGQWRVDWDADDLNIGWTTVTKHMLARADERQKTFRAERRGRCGGWAIEPATEPHDIIAGEFSRNEWNEIAQALDILVGLDEGEHTDADELERLRDLILNMPGVH